MHFMNRCITEKLLSCDSIHLIVDIWTSAVGADFLGLGAVLCKTDQTCTVQRELIMLGMTPMVGAHNAENTKTAVEEIVNTFHFDKSKIWSVVCDEGKNLVRLFKPPQPPVSHEMRASTFASLTALMDNVISDDDMSDCDDYSESDFSQDSSEESDCEDDDEEETESDTEENSSGLEQDLFNEYLRQDTDVIEYRLNETESLAATPFDDSSYYNTDKGEPIYN